MLLNTIFTNILKTSEMVMVIFDLEHFQLLRQFVAFTRVQSVLYILFTLTEMILIKYWMQFILKKVIIKDDAFIVLVLTLENLMMSILFALARVMISDGDFYFILQGSYPTESKV